NVAAVVTHPQSKRRDSGRRAFANPAVDCSTRTSVQIDYMRYMSRCSPTLFSFGIFAPFLLQSVEFLYGKKSFSARRQAIGSPYLNLKGDKGMGGIGGCSGPCASAFSPGPHYPPIPFQNGERRGNLSARIRGFSIRVILCDSWLFFLVCGSLTP